MPLEAWYTVIVIALVIGALISNRIGVDVAMMGGLTLLLVGDAVLPGDVLALDTALGGFAHPAIWMIGGLFVVAAGVQETGSMEAIADRLLGRPDSIRSAQLRLMGPVAIMSAFMNNTPIVAMYLPIVNDWARKLRISPSKLYMPLSFAAILGAKLTYIGTASNVVVMGLFVAFLAKYDLPEVSSSFKFWGVAVAGVPCLVVGMAFIMATSRWLLPERRPADPVTLDARRYQVEMEIQEGAPIVGKTIEEAGLRHLPGLYLTEIERNGDRLPAVPPEERLEAGDRLAFAGILESVVDLRKIRGLVPATDQVEKVRANPRNRTLVEAVVSRGSPLVRRTVRETQFRTRYNAAIIAVHRHGEHVNAKIGNIVLQAGDTLLLDTHAGFVNAYRNSDDFYLVSQVEGARPVRFERAWLALGILIVLVGLLMTQVVEPVVAVLVCALAMIGSRCVTGTIARTSIDWRVLLVIGAALGMGAALQKTSASAVIAHGLIEAARSVGIGDTPHAMFFVLFIITALFAQLITTNGAAVLMFPIVLQAAGELGANLEPFIIGLMIAAGSSFLSPVAYQTNLMVYGPGGYRFTDFIRMGLPLTIVIAIVTTIVTPLAFHF